MGIPAHFLNRRQRAGLEIAPRPGRAKPKNYPCPKNRVFFSTFSDSGNSDIHNGQTAVYTSLYTNCLHGKKPVYIDTEVRAQGITGNGSGIDVGVDGSAGYEGFGVRGKLFRGGFGL